MSSYRLTLAAQDDFEDIGRYTERRWGTRQRRKYLGELIESFSALAAGDSNGRVRNDLKPDLRSQVIGGHVIFFRRTGTVIDVVRILGQRQSAEKAFPKAPSDP